MNGQNKYVMPTTSAFRFLRQFDQRLSCQSRLRDDRPKGDGYH